jgi:hypothetical protein
MALYEKPSMDKLIEDLKILKERYIRVEEKRR